MQLRSFIGVPDHVVIHDFEATDDDSHCTLARLLELLIVVMRRKLYRGQGYSTIHAYCVRGRHMAEFTAFKRVQAAKAASRHRVILSMVAEGRLHLTAILMLAPHLKGPDAEALLLEASHKTKAQLKRMLARIAPKPDVPTCFQTVAPTTSLPPLLEKLAPELVSDRSGTSTDSTGEEPISPPTLLVPIMSGPQARIEPRSPGRIAVQFMLDESEYEELQRAQALAPHEVMPSDVAAFYKWAVREVLKLQEKRRFAATAKPRASKDAPEGRHIPAHVKREVEERDGRQCTFVSNRGVRCTDVRNLEFDHQEAFARGGRSTVGNIRLLCHAHNQLEAERTFGAGFMEEKRRRT